MPEASPATPGDLAGGAVVSRPGSAVRGFLFADLRGYTAFVERAGDRAAADLLERYRRLVREVVATHAGAEVRTEGDSFYVVFPSPSSAVRAGLAIVAAAANDATGHAGDPISVGVGIHAGESAETAEGYVGSAVNVAARICSVARPGEVLVSDTVRGLTRTSLDVAFSSRGRKRLKGVAEPIELWVVRPSGIGTSALRSTGVASRSSRAGLIALGAGVVVVAVMAIAAITSQPPGPAASASPAGSGAGAAARTSASPAPSAGPAALHGGVLEAGTYRTTLFDPAISFTVGPGLSQALEVPTAVVLALADDPERLDLVDSTVGTRLSIMRPTLGVHSCQLALPLDRGPHRDPYDLPPDALEVLPTDRDGLVAWLRADDGIVVEGMDVVRSAGGDAIQMDLRIAPGCTAADSAAKPILLLDKAIAYLMRPNERVRWYIGEVDGRALVFAVNARDERFDDLDAAARSLAISVKPQDGG